MTDLEFNLFFNIHPKDPIKEYAAEYFKLHTEQSDISRKISQKVYRETHRYQKNERERNRRNTDIVYRLRLYLASRILNVLKGKTKSDSTTKLVGCSREFFKKYFHSKFTSGMTWERFMNGEIHIDHIRPCASFDLSKPEEQRLCFHYTNL